MKQETNRPASVPVPSVPASLSESLANLKMPDLRPEGVKQLALQQAKNRAEQGKELLLSMDMASDVGMSVGLFTTFIEQSLHLKSSGVMAGILTRVITPITITQVKKQVSAQADKAAALLQQKFKSTVTSVQSRNKL